MISKQSPNDCLPGALCSLLLPLLAAIAGAKVPDVQQHFTLAAPSPSKRNHRVPTQRVVAWQGDASADAIHKKLAGPVAGRIDLPAPTSPDMRVRIRRLRSD